MLGKYSITTLRKIIYILIVLNHDQQHVLQFVNKALYCYNKYNHRVHEATDHTRITKY